LLVRETLAGLESLERFTQLEELKMARSPRKTTRNVLVMPTPASMTGEANLTADIAKRAFELYCERGCQDGHDVEDWLQAERECRETAGSTAA
jgi:hypothetical protein